MKAQALKHAMNFGLGLGLLFFLNFFVGVYPGWSMLQFVFYILIPILGYKLCVNCRNSIYGGVMSYGQVVWYEFQLFFYASLVSTALKILYLKFINTTYLSDVVEAAAQILESMELPNAEETIGMLEQLYTPFNFSMMSMFANVCIVGLIVSLITAAFVYKKPSLFDKQEEEKL